MGCNGVGWGAESRVQRTVDQGIGILGENQAIVEVGVIEEEMGSSEAVVAGDRRSVDLRDASVEQAISARITSGRSSPMEYAKPTRGATLLVSSGTLPESGQSGVEEGPLVGKV